MWYNVTPRVVLATSLGHNPQLFASLILTDTPSVKNCSSWAKQFWRDFLQIHLPREYFSFNYAPLYTPLMLFRKVYRSTFWSLAHILIVGAKSLLWEKGRIFRGQIWEYEFQCLTDYDHYWHKSLKLLIQNVFWSFHFWSIAISCTNWVYIHRIMITVCNLEVDRNFINCTLVDNSKE